MMRPIIQIERYTQDVNQTSGICSIFDENDHPIFSAVSIERGWRDNEQNVSCIPPGRYVCQLEWSPTFEAYLWEIKGVPNRSECKFHLANYWHQLNGCIALGSRFTKIDKDNYKDVTNSKATMRSFHQALKGHQVVDLIICR